MSPTPQYQYMIGTYGDSTSKTGTITVGASSSSVSGSGTTFLTDLAVGDVIYSAGQTLFVKTITNDTALVLEYVSGAAISGQAYAMKRLTNLEALTSGVAPHSYFRPYVQLAPLGTGLNRGLGKPVAEWRYVFVSAAFKTALRAFCPNTSSTVLIRTLVNDADAMKPYLADMFWPDEAEKQAGRRLNFTIQFKNLRTS